MNSVAEKTTIIAIEVEKNYKKNVVTQKLMLRHNKDLKVEIYVATEEDYVVTIKIDE